MAENAAKELTDKQRRFVREWMIDMNGTRAAIRAGYSEKSAAQTANRLMKTPEVRAYRDELLKEEFDALGVTHHSLAVEVWRLYQRCIEAVPVLAWDSAAKEYVETGQWQFNSKGALKAVAMLMDMLERIDQQNEDAGAGGYEASLTAGAREF